MARLLVHVEGQTEEDFVNEVLRAHLVAKGYHSVDARIVGNARLRQRRGGIRAWHSVKTDIINHLRQDPGCIATMMVDYYALPQSGPGAWPGRAKSAGLRTIEHKTQCVEGALHDDLAATMGSGFNSGRFVPFVVIHEFEGLLFSDCAAFSRGIGRPDLEDDFRGIRGAFATPEEIDDSPETAPSKRVEAQCLDTRSPFLGFLPYWRLDSARYEKSARTSTAG